MNFRTPITVVSMACLLSLSALASANPEQQAAATAEQAESQPQLETEYKEALAEAAIRRSQAEASMEQAREQLHLVTEGHRQETAEMRASRATHHADMARAQEELNRAHRQLRETSREISRVNRELARARMVGEPNEFIFKTGGHPVIGVILGDIEGVGVNVLGVSPDGPSERAGLEPGDVIVALGGTVLAAVGETGDPRTGLTTALKDIKADEPIIVSVERGSQTLDLTVIPEVREPLGWQSVVRFPSAPHAAGETIMIERIEVPEIDTEKLAEQIEQMKIEIDGRRMAIEAVKTLPGTQEFEFEIHEMSELGNFVLRDANVWFGLPLAQGLKLAKVDADLGHYFETDRGVLVLKAKPDNDMQLKSGDVVLQVGETEVNSPSDFMRALREFEPGDEIAISIKRNRKDKTLAVTMPERHARAIAPEHAEQHTIVIKRESN